MALTPSDIPQLLSAGLKAEFEMAYRSSVDASPVEKIATVINTTRPVQQYAWLSAVPGMREFIDERKPSGLSGLGIQISDKVFESTIAVERKAIEDDQLDLIRIRIQELASRVAQHRHKLIIDTLLAGKTTPAYDGANFFSSRTIAGTGYENTTTGQLDAISVTEAINVMMRIPDDQGVPLGVMPDTLLVGPANYWNALELTESNVVVVKDSVAQSTNYANVLKGRLNVVVSPFIHGAQAGAWFLLDSSRPMRSVIMQQRSDVPVEFNAMDEQSGSEAAFMRDRHYYGVRGRYNAGLGLWQLAYGGGL